MTDNQTDAAKVEILPGVQLTPKAQRLLNRQLSRQIIWKYWSGKVVACALGILTMIGSVIFAFMVGMSAFNLPNLLVEGLFFGVPFLIGAGLLYLGVKA